MLLIVIKMNQCIGLHVLHFLYEFCNEFGGIAVILDHEFSVVLIT